MVNGEYSTDRVGDILLKMKTQGGDLAQVKINGVHYSPKASSNLLSLILLKKAGWDFDIRSLIATTENGTQFPILVHDDRIWLEQDPSSFT
jgi:hypothetical protein